VKQQLLVLAGSSLCPELPVLPFYRKLPVIPTCAQALANAA
jgi:hypothetical protein